MAEPAPGAADRAEGALVGLAIGDALGMPTQSLPRSLIQARYGDVIDGFRPAPDDHPLAAGLPAASITDDTEQALLLAELLIERGLTGFDPVEWADRLLRWEARMRERGSLDLLGPSTRSALARLQAGTAPTESGRTGTTNGAAMRIAPVGIAVAEPSALVDLVVEVSAVTHHSSLALAGAAAVAAAVSAGLEGASVADAIEAALVAARAASERGHWVAGADVAERIRWAVELARTVPVTDLLDTVYRLIGTSLAVQESVPAAFAIWAAVPDDPWLACRIAASVGGDCDTIAAMVGAMAGAGTGLVGFPAAARAAVAELNGLRLAEIAQSLLALRRPGAATAAPRLLHAGNVLIDLVLRVDRLPEPGSDVLAGTSAAAVGGGFNVLAAAARQGMPVRYLGAHGSGPLASMARASLRAEGIGLAQLPRPGPDTGYVLCLITADGERTFVTSPGAEASLQPADLVAAQAHDNDLIYLSGYTLLHPQGPAAIENLLRTLPDRATVLFDPGPLGAAVEPVVLDPVCQRADWISCNQPEAQLLTGLAEPSQAAQVLAARYRRAAVLIRLGADGCCYLAAGATPTLVAGYPVTALDSNGAGDAHTGVLLAGLAAGLPVLTAIDRANAAAACAVTRPGPATAPTADELDRFLAEHPAR